MVLENWTVLSYRWVPSRENELRKRSSANNLGMNLIYQGIRSIAVYVECARYFFPFSRIVFRSETGHLLLRMILESFRLHYFFLTSNNTCDEYFALRTQIMSDASSC